MVCIVVCMTDVRDPALLHSVTAAQRPVEACSRSIGVTLEGLTCFKLSFWFRFSDRNSSLLY